MKFHSCALKFLFNLISWWWDSDKRWLGLWDSTLPAILLVMCIKFCLKHISATHWRLSLSLKCVGFLLSLWIGIKEIAHLSCILDNQWVKRLPRQNNAFQVSTAIFFLGFRGPAIYWYIAHILLSIQMVIFERQMVLKNSSCKWSLIKWSLCH